MRCLESSMQQLKRTMDSELIESMDEKKMCIDFDDDQEYNTSINNSMKFEGLEVIKEVSQHDLSCSLQSYSSQMSED